jgi:hypothetical protein
MNGIEKAVEVLREKGWCKGSLQNVKGQHCAQGALGVAICGDSHAVYANFELESGLVADVIREQYPDINATKIKSSYLYFESGKPWETVVYFNNVVCKSQEEMERVLEKAAIKLDEIQ